MKRDLASNFKQWSLAGLNGLVSSTAPGRVFFNAPAGLRTQEQDPAQIEAQV